MNVIKFAINKFQFRFMIYASIITIALAVRDVFGRNVPDIVFSLIVLTALLTLDFKRSSLLVFFLLPLNSGIGFAECLLMYVVIGYLRNWFGITANSKFCFCTILLFIGLVHLFTGYNEVTISSIMQWGRLYIYLPVVYFLSEKKFSVEDKCSLIKSFIVGALIVGLIFVLETIRILGSASIFLGTVRLGQLDKTVDNMMITLNSNDFALLMVLLFMSTVVLYSEKRINTIFAGVSVIGAFIMGIFTQSRAFFICALLYAFLWSFFSTQSHGKLLRNLITIAGIALAIVFVYRNLTEAFQMTIYRFEEDDISNGRFAIWGYYIQLITNDIVHFLFGYGEINRIYYLSTLFGSIKSPHNMLLDILSAWGIIGFFSYMSMLYIILKEQLYHIVSNSVLRWTPLIVFFTYFMSLQYISYGYPILLTLMCIFLVTIIERQTNGTKVHK